MAEKGKFHSDRCPRHTDPGGVCRCIAGQHGLARSSERMYYTGGDSTRAQERRKRQLQQRVARAVDRLTTKGDAILNGK